MVAEVFGAIRQHFAEFVVGRGEAEAVDTSD